MKSPLTTDIQSSSGDSDNRKSDYLKVSQAISFLRSHHHQQPTLSDVAGHLHLSESHTQKLFTHWAGISPKRFLQFLTIEYAKQRMLETGDLLTLALESGLSGPGRLHDLFVNMEGMSPGEFKQAAQGIIITYGMGTTPFGTALIAFTERGICHLSFVEPGDKQTALDQLQQYWPQAKMTLDTSKCQALLDKIFQPTPEQIKTPLSLWVCGTNFQIQVWRALLQIPLAGILNYQQLAQLLGKPKAARAVGNAIAKNPVAFLIPCHRVLRQSGDFGKYHWGETRKAALIAWEAARDKAET